jgi:hypothetical protein
MTYHEEMVQARRTRIVETQHLKQLIHDGHGYTSKVHSQIVAVIDAALEEGYRTGVRDCKE